MSIIRYTRAESVLHDFPRRLPSKRPHREVIVIQVLFKERKFAFIRGKTVSEFRTVVRPDAFNFKLEESQHLSQEYSRTVRAVLIKGFDTAKTAVPVYRSILTEPFPFRFPDMAYLRYELDVCLDALSRIIHLLIWLRYVLLRGRKGDAHGAEAATPGRGGCHISRAARRPGTGADARVDVDGGADTANTSTSTAGQRDAETGRADFAAAHCPTDSVSKYRAV